MKDNYIRTTELDWKEIQEDVFEKECVAGEKGVNISLLKIEPNREIPLHKHADTRYNYILKGEMSDGNQTYIAGDLITNGIGSQHFLKAGPAGCEFLLMWD